MADSNPFGLNSSSGSTSASASRSTSNRNRAGGGNSYVRRTKVPPLRELRQQRERPSGRSGGRAAAAPSSRQPPPPAQPSVTDPDARFQRLSEIQRGMRSALNNFRVPSSLYSTPNAHLSMVNGASTTPRPPLRRFFGQWGEESGSATGAMGAGSSSRDHLPLHAQPQPVSGPLDYSPATQPFEWDVEAAAADAMGPPEPLSYPGMRGPAPVPVAEPTRPGAAVTTNPRGLEIPTLHASVESETAVSSEGGSRSRSASEGRSGTSGSGTRRDRHARRHRHHHHDTAWVRGHRHGTKPRRRAPLHEDGHAKYLASIVSGLFLTIMVVICKLD
jgi:hypothetical protein